MSHRFILKPSLIPSAGIGCFSLSHAAPGARLQADRGGFRWLQESDIPEEYLKYCVLYSDRYLAPLDFLHMGVFWYINHAKHPNTVFNRGRLEAVRDIEPGEELTL